MNRDKRVFSSKEVINTFYGENFNELYEKYPCYRNIVFDGEIYIRGE